KNALLMDAVQRGDQDDINAATEQSYGRKLREAKLAISLEKQWSKDEILGAYLNVSQFGPSQYGVETAAQHYYSKSAADLDPGEAAMLAGITNGPNYYDPVANPENGEKRRNEVLTTMHREGYISEEELEEYTSRPVEDMLNVQNVRAGCADAGGSGFFCDYVTRTLLNDPEFAPTLEERRKLLYGGGLTIRTSLDPELQSTAEEILQEKVPGDAEHGFGHSIVTVEPGTGEILTMAQNRSFNPYEDSEPGEAAINFNVPQPLGGASGFPVGPTCTPFARPGMPTTGRSLHARGAPPDVARRWRAPYPAPRVRPVLDAAEFSSNPSSAKMARRLDPCAVAVGAPDIVAIPGPCTPPVCRPLDTSSAHMYRTELA